MYGLKHFLQFQKKIPKNRNFSQNFSFFEIHGISAELKDAIFDTSYAPRNQPHDLRSTNTTQPTQPNNRQASASETKSAAFEHKLNQSYIFFFLRRLHNNKRRTTHFFLRLLTSTHFFAYRSAPPKP